MTAFIFKGIKSSSNSLNVSVYGEALLLPMYRPWLHHVDFFGQCLVIWSPGIS